MTYKLINNAGKVIAEMDLETAYRMLNNELERTGDFLPVEIEAREGMRRELEKAGVDWKKLG